VLDGVTGFVRREPDELVEALRSLDQIDPRACRTHVEENFGPDRMVSGYEQVYRDCLRVAAASTAQDASARNVTQYPTGQAAGFDASRNRAHRLE